MNIHETVPIFTELMNEESAVVSGGQAPQLVFDGKNFKIVNVDGYGREVIFSESSYNPDNNIVGQIGLPAIT